ncbi:MAG: hypothetical protein QXQ90_01025 [Desulfurococcaceae archaeon]
MLDDELGRTVYDSRTSEVVDSITGEVVDEKLIDRSGRVRAFSYEEYERKKHHEVYVSEDDRRLMGMMWRVGKEINAPEWLINEAFWFVKKARVLKTKLEFKGKSLYPFKEKYVYAIYFVLSHKYGLFNIASRIASMRCNESGEQCYISRKKGDKEFRQYLRSIRHFASYIYPNRARDPVILLDEIVAQYRLLPDVIYKKAREYALKMRNLMSGRKTQTVVAAAIKMALDEVIPSKSSYIMAQICRLLNVSEPSIKNLIKTYQSVNSNSSHQFSDVGTDDVSTDEKVY